MQRKFHSKPKISPRFIAIAGGSGAGKSWLAERLQKHFGKEAAVVSLDNFYRDRSYLSERQRQQINFDDPKAIDWSALKNSLLTYQRGKNVLLPVYDFATHSRTNRTTRLTPKRLVILEGMWLLRPAWLRKLCGLKIYIDCPETTRRARRVQRDQRQRSRTKESICEQFEACVTPMHWKFVEPQKQRADLILTSPLGSNDIKQLVDLIQTQLQRSYDQS